jgi:hypothetical protein
MWQGEMPMQVAQQSCARLHHQGMIFTIQSRKFFAEAIP